MNKIPFNFEITKTKYVKITTSENLKNQSIFSSKLGGIPYWPENGPMVYPTIEGKIAKLMAQINLTQLSEQSICLPQYFPTQGILQFFCEYQDETWGINFKDMQKSRIKVVYHKDIEKSVYIDNDILSVSQDNSVMPYETELSMIFSNEEELLGSGDYFNFYKFFKVDPIQVYDDFEEYFESLENSGSKMAGYAYFTQEDPRDPTEQENKWILLLQIDTDKNICIGDAGVMQWFIKEEDLKNKNFDNIFFNWDCC